VREDEIYTFFFGNERKKRKGETLKGQGNLFPYLSFRAPKKGKTVHLSTKKKRGEGGV